MVNKFGNSELLKTNKMQQETAVDYIFRKLDVLCRLTPQTRVTGTSEEWENLYKKAKAMEKEQMKGMYTEGGFAQMRYFDGKEFITAEQYYNETYAK